MSDHITSIESLRDIYKQPADIVIQKQIGQLDKHAQNFIGISPFLVISSNDGNGLADASPRGEVAGFVKILDDLTLIIPDRPGNNRLDTLENIIENPGIGLLFFVPGMNETLRVNGHAEISSDETLLALCEENGKLPKTVIKLHVKAVYMHCAKAFIRSKLWDQDAQIERSSFPSLGQILKDQMQLKVPTKVIDAGLKLNAKTTLY